LASLDYSQIELRLAAALTGEKHMIEAFLRGEDIHRQTAAEIFGVEEKEVTKEMRSRAKTSILAFCMEWVGGLAAATKMSRAEAEDFLADITGAIRPLLIMWSAPKRWHIKPDLWKRFSAAGVMCRK